MRILVTGGAGYVGSVSVERLVQAGHEVTVFDNLATGHRRSVPANVVLVEGSFADSEAIGNALERGRIEAVLHCAAKSLVGESMADPAGYYRTNVMGGVTLLDAMRRLAIQRIVFSSTAAVYGAPDTSPIPEDALLRPVNPYGETKRVFESAMAWYATFGLRSVSLRYFNVAGATDQNGEFHDPETHLIPNALLAVEGGPPLILFGDDYPTPDGTPIRDYIHVMDLADAHLAALEATSLEASAFVASAPGASAPEDPRTARALVCNLGSGGGFSVKQVLAATEQVVGRPVPHAIGPRRVGDPPVLVASIDRAAIVLDWRPQRSTLEAMIGSAWAWRQRHPSGYRVSG